MEFRYRRTSVALDWLMLTLALVTSAEVYYVLHRLLNGGSV